MAIYDDVVTRLAMFGYTATPDDTLSIEYAVNQAAAYILTQTNLAELPEGLHYAHVDYAAGLFLQGKAAGGQLGEAFTGSGIKGITEGDVRVEYDTTSSPESRTDSLIKRLTSIPEKQLAAFRRLKW